MARGKRKLLAGFGLVATAAIALAGCGSSGGNADSTSAGAGGSAVDAAGSIILGFPGTIGPTDTPLIAALNSLGEEGWEIEYVEFDSPDVQTQALMGGDVNVASMGPATVMAANDAGAELKMVGNNNILDYQIIASADVETCSDLDGRTVAYHSEGSTSTAHLRRYLADNCPDAEPNFVVISGSGNRVTALLEGQIDGTIVRVEDWMAAGADPSVAHVIDNLNETQADLLTQTIVIDGARTEDSASAAIALLEALDAQFEAVNEDPAAFAATAAEILGSDVDEVLPVLEALVDAGTFPASHELRPESIEATLAFYRESGTISDSLTADQVADLNLSSGE